MILIIEQDENERCFQNINTNDDQMHYIPVSNCRAEIPSVI